jgi:serine/threonine-protein kinase HipA
MNELEVMLYGQVVGTLFENKDGVYFEYTKAFINGGLEISPIKLPLKNGLYTNRDEAHYQTLAGVFHDSLPDKFGTAVIEKYYETKGVPSSELSVLQKLAFVGDRAMGGLEYKPKEKLDDDTPLQEALAIRGMYDASRIIVEDKPIEAIHKIMNFMRSGASAGGARAKAIIGWDRDKKMMKSGGLSNDDYEQWIIKFDTLDERTQKSSDFTKLEYLYMKMAKECEINVPQIELMEDGELTHFLIKRFDRLKGNQKVHMHSLAAMTHVDFNQPMHYSYDDALRLTSYITNDERDTEELFRRAVFNVIARNQDDHAKNTSYLMDEKGKWRLSPAYDITYANGQGFTKNHQMSMAGKITDLTRDDIYKLAEKTKLIKTKQDEIMEQISNVFSHFRDEAKILGINQVLISRVSKELRLDLCK